MIDRLGRKIDYLRISVTDRCNLRCIYCMPEKGVKLVERSLLLREEEILRIVSVMAELGIRKIKLTGGEPLLYCRLPELIAEIKAISGIEKVTVTTNGILLKEQMEGLAEAGTDGINVSLDTLDRECFRRISRRDLLDKALDGVREVLRYPGISLKINCVPLGAADQDVCAVARLARENPVHVRFIEMMPIGYGAEFPGMTEEPLKNILEERFGRLVPYQGAPLGNGPCKYYEAEGFAGKIGFISAVSHKFCGECNRIRLTSQGYLKTCLQYTAGRDLREIIRNGCTDEELKDVIRAALNEKPDGHHFLEKAKNDDTEKLCMSQIGG